MARGRLRHEWSQTASLMALLVNLHRDPRSGRRPAHPDDFNPYALKRPEAPKAAPGGFEMLKALLEEREKTPPRSHHP
jgi:hypothetical protein